MHIVKVMIYALRFILPVFLLAIISACGSGSGSGGGANNPEGNDVPSNTLIEGSWSAYWPDLFHDGNSVSSDNFIVYSEASSMASRDLGMRIHLEEAFEQHFGMSMKYLEDNWWNLLEAYLAN